VERAVLTRGAMRVTNSLGLCVAILCVGWSSSALAYSNTSRFGIHVGFDESDNVYLFCSPYNITRTPLATSDSVTTRFRRFTSASAITESVVSSVATTQARLQCFPTSARTGTPTIVLGTTNEGSDKSTAKCPASAPYGAFAECRVLSDLDALQKPYVYRATACGNGIASMSSQLTGQATGKQGVTGTVVDQNGNPATFFYNDTVGPASIVGTDEGVPFFSAGKMHFAFGDTNFSNNSRVNNTLATASTVAPFFGGYWLGGWHGTSANDTMADQVILPRMSDEAQCGDTGMIPTGGFALTSGATTTRFLWFMSVKTWNFNPATNNSCDMTDGYRLRVNRASLAYSQNGGSWTRADLGYPMAGVWWDAQSKFTSAFAYHQIIGGGSGYVYFYGFAADNNMPDSNSGVYLARARATVGDVLTKSSYEYWNGSSWVANNEAAAAPLSGIAAHARELSVAFNSYANRYMMLVTDTTNGMRMYQSEALEGPWSFVATLPYVIGNYAALTHDRFQADQGKNFGYYMSQWFPAYNVGNWWATITRNTYSNCVSGDP